MFDDDNIAIANSFRRNADMDAQYRVHSIELMRTIADSIISKLNDLSISKVKDGVDVNNLDEIKLALRVELGKVVKQLSEMTSQIKDIRVNPLEKTIVNNIPISANVTVDNLKDVPLIKSISIDNFDELKSSLDSISKEINSIDLPAPIVNIPKTDAPIVNVQPTPVVVNGQEIDLSPIIKSLESNLNKLRTNSETRPLAVRITDGNKWVKQVSEGIEKGSRMAFTSFPGALQLKDSLGMIVSPATNDATLDALAHYKITDQDKDSAPNYYYGYITKDGYWYIMRQNTTTGAYRYAKGSSEYTTNWTNRASLTYDYFDIIF